MTSGSRITPKFDCAMQRGPHKLHLAVATGAGQEYVRGPRKHFRRGYPGILGRLGNFKCHFFSAKNAHDVSKTNRCNPTDIGR
jgi:hypothetical protein